MDVTPATAENVSLLFSFSSLFGKLGGGSGGRDERDGLGGVGLDYGCGRDGDVCLILDTLQSRSNWSHHTVPWDSRWKRVQISPRKEEALWSKRLPTSELDLCSVRLYICTHASRTYSERTRLTPSVPQFRRMCTGEFKDRGKVMSYQGSSFHRVVSCFLPFYHAPSARPSILFPLGAERS
jgi:hypothetical protein